MELHQALDAVCDENTFLQFARQLLADREAAAEEERERPPHPSALYGARGWQNVTIDGFLEAAIAWTEDSAFGTRQGLSRDNPWKQFAVFLYCGKIYE
jgi:hypothetical protein